MTKNEAPAHPPRVKRIFDVCLALWLLLLLSPLFLMIALFELIFHGRPIFFTQTRPGLHGDLFKMIKFRTMSNQKDENGKLCSDAERLTTFGKFLRVTSLDELPEIVNVLFGQMSFVGPRPLLVQYLDRYTPEQARRHWVLPGITGWAQINGRNNLSWEDKFALDVWYVDHWSIWLDLRILLLTPLKVLKQEGITSEGNATAKEFMGSQENDAKESSS